MALDVGSKTIGVAITDPLKITVGPLKTLLRENLESDAELRDKIIKLGRENVSHYKWATTAGETLSILEKVNEK